MAGYNIRSLAELGAQARQFFTQSVDGAVASLWANTFAVFAKVLALLDFEHELRRAWLFKQIFASTADELWLARHAYEYGLAQGAGLPALGQVVVACPPGTVVPAGLSFVRADGVAYTTLSGAIAAGTSVTLYLEADAVGADGNAPAGTTLDLSPDTAAPVGLGGTAVVVAADDGSGLSGGVDAEDPESLRARVLDRKRNPPQGGAAQDYRTWVAASLPGLVDQVFVDSFQNDSRSVWVMFTARNTPDGRTDPASVLAAYLADPVGTVIPTLAQVARAQAYIDDDLRKPVTARAFLSPPTPIAVPLTIAGLTPDTDDIRAAVAAELAAVFLDRAEPGKPTKGDFVLSRSWLEEAISRATGEDRHRLPLPADDLTFGAGEYPVLGTISYTS